MFIFVFKKYFKFFNFKINFFIIWVGFNSYIKNKSIYIYIYLNKLFLKTVADTDTDTA
jgi:hypothetical protein